MSSSWFVGLLLQRGSYSPLVCSKCTQLRAKSSTFPLLLQRVHAAQQPRHANSFSSPPSNPCRNNRLRVISVKHNGRSPGSGSSRLCPPHVPSRTDGDTHRETRGASETPSACTLNPASISVRKGKRSDSILYLLCTTRGPDSLDLFSSSICHMPRCRASALKRRRRSDLQWARES